MTTDKQDQWVTIQGNLDEQPAFVRINNGVASKMGISTQPDMVAVTIHFIDPDSNGLCPDDEKSMVDKIEEEIVTKFCDVPHTDLCLCIMTDGAQDLFFYTGEPDEILRIFEEEIQESELTQQVELHIEADEEWELYQNYYSGGDED